MKTSPDLTNQTFGRLTAIKKEKDSWLCECICGKKRTVKTYDLTHSKTRSCGCLRREITGKQFTKHGQSKNRRYNVWASIVDRCENPNSPDYHHYGGRGIKICERWRNSVEDFIQDMGEQPSPKHSVDRINTNGDYEPSNCRWATQKEQTRNMRRNHMLTWEGKTQCISAWAEELNVPRSRFHDRLKLGWSVEKIFQRTFEETVQRESQKTEGDE